MKLPVGKFSMGKLSLGKLPKARFSLGKLSRGRQAPGPETPALRPQGGKPRFTLPKRIPLTKSTVAFGSGVIIFSVGFVLQNFGSHPASRLQDATAPEVQTSALMPSLEDGIGLQAITPTSASLLPMDRPLPMLPRDSFATPVADGDTGTAALATLEDTAAPTPLAPEAGAAVKTAQSDPALPCEITLTADPAPAAMVDLTVAAACLPDARFTLHHSGMMFHALTDDAGRARLRVPALARNAVFITSFENNEGAVAQIEVPTLEFYDRVVAQWRGHAGLGLHALEFDASYFGAGHIHSASPNDLSAATSGTSGFLTRFGENAGGDALMAEVYTFPSRTSDSVGRIGLSVEAEVTAANCGKEIAAQTLQLKPGEKLRTRDVTLYLPACDAEGDFLVLKNLFEDLKVAAN